MAVPWGVRVNVIGVVGVKNGLSVSHRGVLCRAQPETQLTGFIHVGGRGGCVWEARGPAPAWERTGAQGPALWAGTSPEA